MNSWERRVPTHKDFLLYMQEARRAQPAPTNPMIPTHAERAQSVLDHPGWVVFEREVEDEIVRVKSRLEGAKTHLVNSLDTTEALLPYRFQIRHLEGLLLGLRFAKDLMPKVIAEGNQSVLASVAHS